MGAACPSNIIIDEGSQCIERTMFFSQLGNAQRLTFAGISFGSPHIQSWDLICADESNWDNAWTWEVLWRTSWVSCQVSTYKVPSCSKVDGKNIQLRELQWRSTSLEVLGCRLCVVLIQIAKMPTLISGWNQIQNHEVPSSKGHALQSTLTLHPSIISSSFEHLM